MATKKSAAKKTAGSVESVGSVETPAVKAASKKTAVKKTAAKKTPEKTVEASAPDTHGQVTAKKKAHPSHHDIATHAYLLWERDGKKHGQQDHYWKLAEQELGG